MDPVALILSFMVQNPNAAGQMITQVTRPGHIDASRLNSSLIDFSRQALKCYHRTARFVDANMAGDHWEQQYKYGADGSMIVRIVYEGAFTHAHYEMVLVAMTKKGAYRTKVVYDDAVIPYNKKCALEEWVDG